MGIVIGPIPADDWGTMRDIRATIRYYEERRDPRFDRAKKKYSKLYKLYRDEYLGKAA